VNRPGWTLIELLAVMFVMMAATVVWTSVASEYGPLLGAGAGLLAGALSVIVVGLFYRWTGQQDERRLQELREKFRGIYRIVAVPADPKIIVLPKGAEIRIGDYGWEAGPIRNDGFIYLQGLTLDWTVVWHAGFCPDQIEWVATKPNSQYDSWHPYWAPPPPLSSCPFPVVERETLTVGRPHHRHWYGEEPALYRIRRSPRGQEW
jgi:hypothetical protein